MATLVAQSQTQVTAYKQTNLVSDGFVKAPVIDPNLINPWGVSSNPLGVLFPRTSPFWVSDNGTGLATIYDGNGKPAEVSILGVSRVRIATPFGQMSPATPTGQVFNIALHGFRINSDGRSAPSAFIFATEDGTISGWNPGVDPTTSIIAVDNSRGDNRAVYKGLAIGTTNQGTFLYAANFRGGTVDVFDSHFRHVQSFTDSHLPKGYAPFNVQVLNGRLFVTFALQDSAKEDDVAGAGHGFVDEFNLKGHLLRRVESGGPLNSPWGLAIAPTGFGQFSHDLLVGNFGDGTISVFNPKNDKYLGKLRGANGAPIKIGDLWALVPGTRDPSSDPRKIYFTAGVKDEAHGLFGSLGAITDTHHATVATLPSQHMVG